MSNLRTEVNELGEFKLIEYLTKKFTNTQPSTILGVGDDAAIFQHENQTTLITTDLLVEGIHFDLSYTPLHHLGYKAVAVNLSDIFAMNANPTAITVSLAFSNRFSVEALEEIYHGIRLACEKYKVDLIGGDTSSAQKGMVISVTAVGTAPLSSVVKRSGAQVGDLICVSGDLGAAYMGLQLLEREKRIFQDNPDVQPDLKSRPYILERFLKPEPRADIISWLKAENIIPTAMMDVSDGLSSELLHITQQSNCGCMIYEEHIPIHEETRSMAEEFKIPALTCALNGGEDYELLFTVNEKYKDKIDESLYVKVIGDITDKETGAFLTTNAGKNYPLMAQGWNAFKE